jgi:hypothetical protein
MVTFAMDVGLQGVMELFTSYTVGMAEAFAKYKGKDGRFPQLLGMTYQAHLRLHAAERAPARDTFVSAATMLTPQAHATASAHCFLACKITSTPAA